MRRTIQYTALAASAGVAGAQVARPFGFGVGGGVTFPTGDAADVVKTGYNARALVSYRAPLIPIGIRGEFAYDSFEGKTIDIGAGLTAKGNLSLYAGTVNAVYTLPGAVIRPYLIGGVGFYHAKLTFGGCCGSTTGSQHKPGVNGGAGLELGLAGISTFVEARFHNVFTDNGDTRVVPITFGLMF